MFETELKFQVPARQWAGLRKAVATASAVQTRLQALYVETPGHDLAAAGLALRLRKEGRVWVQTLKGRGDGLMQRLEHEVRLPPQAGLPALDPARHDGSPAGALLRQVLDAARAAGRSDELQVLYRTDIRRTHRRLRHGGAVVELALDEGQIVADASPAAAPGTARPPRRQAVAEIEFELLSGPPQALAALAARWAQRHGLWWDVRTKSERGFRLALGREHVPAVRAARQQLPAVAAARRGAGAAPTEALAHALAPALAAMLNNTLAQALPNLAEIAEASSPEGAAPEHLHQFRVAVRRLRSALRLFADWAPLPAEAHALEARWREVFTALGAARDADVLATVWQPRLQAAGAPPLAVRPPAAAPSAAPGELLRTPEVSVLLLDTLALALQLAREPGTQGAPADAAGHQRPSPGRAVAAAAAAETAAAAAARAVLRRAWKAAWADARHFARVPVERQHRARKRLKRLRYALEFTAPWLPAQALKRWHRKLARALEALGEHNDLHAARAHYAALVELQPQAWFALGWLAAQEAATCQRAQAALDKLEATPLPWKTGKR
jgi:inorganic triphosphatase YgiF